MSTAKRSLVLGTGLVLVLAACGTQDSSSEPPASQGASGSPAAGACEIAVEDGVLQPVASGFPNDTITLLVPDSPGSSDDIWARNLQAAAESLSPVRIEVENREDFTAFGTWEALQDMGRSEEGNSGYIGLVHTTPGDVTDLHMQPITEETGLDVQDRNTVIALEQEPYMIVQRADAEWGRTWDDMVAYAQENPGEIRYISREVGSSLDIAMEYYMDAFDIETEKIIGGPQPEMAAILGAGEGDIAMMTPSNILPHFEAGRIDVIAVMADDSPEPWQDAPQITDLGDVFPWATTRQISVTTEVDDCHREWLFELFRTAAEDEEYREARAQVPGLLPILFDHDEAMEFSQDAHDRTEAIVRELGLHWDQQ